MDLPIDENVGGVTSEVSAMSSYFAGMVAALTEYKAYLPRAVLMSAVEHTRAVTALPAVEPPTGHVAVLFTDVVSSTKLWEASPESMDCALELHNNVARELISICGGYEVKTIGDSFMVSFEQPTQALRFGLEFHLSLLATDWPDEYLFSEVLGTWERQVSADGDVLWNGLTVRIGISYGEVQHEINPMTGRIDYRGKLVNLAARLEGAAQQGTVLVSEECMAAVRGSGDIAAAGDAVYVERMPMELKGLGNVQTVAAVPRSLRARFEREPDAAGNPLSRATSIRTGSLFDSSGRCSISSTRSSISGSVRVGRFKLLAGQGTVGVMADIDSKLSALAGAPDLIFSVFQKQLNLLISAASRTQGAVGGVLGTSALVTWNAVTPCFDHPTQGLTFASLLSRANVEFVVGLASGKVLDGPAGLTRQRFHAVLGRSVALAHSAAAAADALFTTCLACFDPAPPPVLEPFLRVVDTWGVGTVMSAEHRVVPVYLPDLEEIQRSPWDLCGSTTRWDTAADPHTEQAALYVAGLRGSIEATDGLAKRAGDDETLCKVVALLRMHIRRNPGGASFRVEAPFTPHGYDTTDGTQEPQPCDRVSECTLSA
eukprot:TRINITY_DN4207_c0_g2_i1.p1 TRINITY_DN4207_c0_g2~~TRINITY_DN4207_c0_g2_i1.p1  ORF type:complete len:600 (+),score=116.12 TRINITY_DN4207_c0_g2_i1:2-1801(+)